MVPAPIGAQIPEPYIWKGQWRGDTAEAQEKAREVDILSSGGRPVLIWINSDK